MYYYTASEQINAQLTPRRSPSAQVQVYRAKRVRGERRNTIIYKL